MIIEKLIRKYRDIFGLPDQEIVRETFSGELNYESSKLFFILFVTIAAWLPYIPNDLQMHQYPWFAVSLRLGLAALSLALIALRFTKKFRPRPDLLLMTLVIYLLFGTSLITATSGEYAASYIGGFTFILMIPMFAPMRWKYKVTASVLSVALFFLAGSLTEMDFSSLHIRYSLSDLIVALVISTLLSLSHDTLRHTAWTQRKKLKKAIEDNEKNLTTIFNFASKAEASGRAKSNFLATMSHEIRTPMNAIIGIAQIQMQKGNLPDEYADALEKIYNSGNNLLGIINDILDMSKIETGKLELAPVEYDISSLINDAVQLNIIRIGSKPIEFMLGIDENLPSKLCGDELRLKQILNNLLSNAIKYTEKGRVKMSVSHSAEGENVLLRFVIEDTGQGMKAEDQKQLFSEYSRFNAEANRATEGTGLGLNITKKLVEMMGGTIAAESEYGSGSTFTVTVRQKAVECAAIGAELAERLRNFKFTGDRQVARLKIARELMPHGNVLVVDDVETNLYVAEGLLLPYALNVETAISGFVAIEKAESGKAYDIIFMDHMMPEMDGMETTKKLRAMGYRGTIVALTANALVGQAEIFIENGFDDFLSKPIDIFKLDEILKKWIPEKKRESEVGSREWRKGETPESSFPPLPIPHSPFPSIPGVDAQRGMAMTGGKIEFYRKVLATFSKDAEERLPLFQTVPGDDTLPSFATQVHALKSASASIGAAEVSARAAELEGAARGGDIALIGKQLPVFAEQLAELVKNIRAFLETNAGTEGSETPALETPVSHLRELSVALKSQKADDIDRILEELNQKNLNADFGAALEKISDNVLMAEFDSAIHAVEELIAANS